MGRRRRKISRVNTVGEGKDGAGAHDE